MRQTSVMRRVVLCLLLILGVSGLTGLTQAQDFTRVTDGPLVSEGGASVSTRWIDFDGDGWLDVYIGNALYPNGQRNYLYHNEGDGRFVDRSLACTFFRPDRSVGVWAEGEYLPHRYYRMMIGDGFNTSGLQPVPAQIDNNFVYSATTWWDIGERYGRGYSDLEWHDQLGLEIGTSFTYGREVGPTSDRVGTCPQRRRFQEATQTEWSVFLESVQLEKTITAPGLAYD